MKSVIDVSNLNGMGYRSLAEYQRADGLYVQAIPRPRPNGIVAQQLYAGRDDGKALGIYSWLWHDPTWRMDPDLRADQRLRLETVPNDVQLVMRPMIDVEDNVSTGWQSVSVQQRKDDLMVCLDVLHAFAVARNLPDPGIYWSAYYINLLFDGWVPDGVFQWKAHYGIQPGSLIGGFVVGHQFSSTPIDQSIFVDSELQPSQEADVPIPQEYVDKFHLGSNQDIQGLIDNFEGVITTTREIALAEGEAAGLECEVRLERIKQVLTG
jgi:hypothetical protein